MFGVKPNSDPCVFAPRSSIPIILLAKLRGRPMLKFHGVMGRRGFFWACALRIGLFLASVPAQAFVLLALVRATHCDPVACNVVGLLGQMGYRWWVAAIFVFSFAGISMRRARDAGVPGWVGLLIPLLLAADGAFLQLIGEWSPRFALPRNVMLALACMAGLCALPSRRHVIDSSNPFGNAGRAAFGLGLFIAANAAVTVV